jgi:hypothetical protein
MLIIALVFIFFAILAVAYELHFITALLIEIGTIVEYYNRRDLRATGIIKEDDEDDFDGESVTKVQKTWRQIVLGILLASLATLAGMGLYGLLDGATKLH